MASKRMFAMTIVDSDVFLDMPLSTQALYFHLNMRADDDGFVGNPKKIMRTIGASEDDMKLLIAKNFLITFETGVIVIKHWRIHNTLSTGRYHETSYTAEKDMLKLKRNNAYSLTDGVELDDTKLIESAKRQVDEQKTNNRRTIDEQKTNADKIRVEESSIGLEQEQDKNKCSKGKKDTIYHRYGEYKHILLTDDQYSRLVNDYGAEKTLQAIKKVDEYCQLSGKTYKDYNLAIRKWGFDGGNKDDRSKRLQEANDLIARLQKQEAENEEE